MEEIKAGREQRSRRGEQQEKKMSRRFLSHAANISRTYIKSRG